MATNSDKRLLYLDWVRGLAALIMLQGHVFHSFLKPELREGGAYVFSQFLGGMPPAVFLFLTGITLSFLMDSSERKGLGPVARWTTAMRRSSYLFTVAFLFRLQLWAFAWPDSPWTDMLKVDILNAMGFAILVLSALALFRTVERVRFAALAGLAIAAVSPLVSQIQWGPVAPLLRDYIVPDYNHFGFFPWAAYVAFGVSAGSLLRIVNRDHLDRVMQWSALLGIGIVVGAYYFSTQSYSLYGKAEFWLNSPAQILIKQGVLLLILPFAYLWTQYGAPQGGWSWVRTFGTTSLLVYWVHIELVYGRWLWFFKNGLDVGQTVIAAVLVIVLMLLLAVARKNYDRWLPTLRDLFLPPPPPKRVPGD